MKRVMSIVAALALLLYPFEAHVAAQAAAVEAVEGSGAEPATDAGVEGAGEAVEPWEEIAAAHAILMDADTGQVLFEREMLEQAHPASITKIMTALLVVENGSFDDVVTASGTAVAIPSGSTAIWMEEGEQMTVDEALYATMLRSANDTANLLAEYISGSQAAFTDAMNQRAAELGARSTHFANASGLPRRNHLTTAYDMALITRAAIRYPAFMTYFGAESYSMAETNLGGAREFVNGQSMLVPDSIYYNGDVVGGKVGYTDQARHTMATVASRDGRTLICVVMGCGREEKFTDTEALLEYGFSGFEEAFISSPAPGPAGCSHHRKRRGCGQDHLDAGGGQLACAAALGLYCG